MTNSKEVKENQPTPLEETPNGGLSPGKLKQYARKVNTRSLESRLMSELLKEKTGMLNIEVGLV